MSDLPDDPPGKKKGYGHPPAEHRFKKGQSGNRRGRPPKVQRLYAPRQARRDVLSVTEAPTTFNTPEGRMTVPTAVAVLMVMRNKALAGHGPSMRYLLTQHYQALAAHHNLRLYPSHQDPAATFEGLLSMTDREFDENNIYRKLLRKRRRTSKS